MRKVLEVEGGFIAKEYNDNGDVVAQSVVVESALAAEDVELTPLKQDETVSADAPTDTPEPATVPPSSEEGNTTAQVSDESVQLNSGVAEGNGDTPTV